MHTTSIVVLAFDPSLINFVVEYMLVCDFASDLERYEFEIYSSVNGSWKVLAEISFSEIKLFPRTGVHVNSIIYWSSF
jgi:hypothetical protein